MEGKNTKRRITLKGEKPMGEDRTAAKATQENYGIFIYSRYLGIVASGGSAFKLGLL